MKRETARHIGRKGRNGRNERVCTRQFVPSLFLLTMLLVFVSSTALGQTGLENYDPNKPIRIAADRLEADNTLHSVRFLGNVVAVQGEAVLNADMIVLRYKPEKVAKKKESFDKGILESMPARQGNAIDSLVATGRVTLIHKNRRAQCRQAVYHERSRTITLTGKPQLWQGADFLAGSKIVLNLDTEKVEVSGGRNTRVTAQIMPNSAQAELDDAAKKRLENLLKEAPAPPDQVPDKKDD